MIVTRDGDSFDVLPLNDDWDFWGKRFSTDWEPETKEVIERFVHGGTFLDVGAWVGPTTLWASRHAERVIAIEPDPVAYEHLKANTAGLSNVVTFRCAVGEPGSAVLCKNGELGNSESSLVAGSPTEWTTDVHDLESFVSGGTPVQLVKMDIEGGEGIVIPREHEFLRELGAPLLLSLHPYLWPEDPRPYLSDWTCEQIAPHEMLYIP